ncbi:MAG: TonB-dependent receptor [Pseudomonadota bacterium]
MTSTLTRRLLAATMLAGTAPLAFAQETLDTIIVTTPGPDRDADELIGNVSVLDREELIEKLAGSLGDTLDREPGVASASFGAAASRPVLRGLGADRVQVLTNGIGVIDVSAASPDHQVTADGIDSEKVEILRGPAALAYGGQAIGGVVNVIDGLIVEDLPEEPYSAELFTAYNTVNEGTELGGRGQFTTGPFVFTLSASARDFDNYDIPDFAESSLLRAMEEEEEHDEEEHDEEEHEEEEEVRDTLENSFVETQTIAAGLSWVGDNAFFGVAVRQQTAEYGLPGHGGHEHGHGEEEAEGGEGGEGAEIEEEEEEENPFIDLEQTRIDLRGGVSVDNGFLTDVVGSLAIVDYEHTEFEAPGEAGTLYETEGVEGRIEFDHVIGGFEGAFGLQYTEKDLSAIGEEAFVSPTETESIGVFVYETQEWESGVGIEGGLRFEMVDRDNVVFGSTDFDLISGSFGVHRHMNNGVFIGGQFAYTERAPSETELFAFGPHLATEQFEVGNATFEEESALNFEGTVRWSNESGGIGANLFITEFSDFIYLTPGEVLIDGEFVDEEDELPVFLFVQEDASFFGGEIYADYVIEAGPLGADWEFDASIDFVETELPNGGNVPLIPPVTLNAGASAEWGAFEFGTALTIAGDQDDPGDGELETDGYTTLDLRAEVDLSDFGFGADGTELFVEARNVTDEEVRYSTSVLKDVAPAPGQNFRFGIRATF